MTLSSKEGGGSNSINVYNAITSLTERINRLDPYNGHEYVEIGGLKWATMNIGASSVTDYGLYFSWGDTQGYTADQVGIGKKNFNWTSYKYGNGTSSPDATGMTKYNSTDGKTVLEASDDAAQACWSGLWRMPTRADFQALSAATTNEWVTNYQGSGVNGRLFTDNTDSSKTLFFPAAGIASNLSVGSVGSIGYYWSSSCSTVSPQYGFKLLFSSASAIWDGGEVRCYGFAVRGVVG